MAAAAGLVSCRGATHPTPTRPAGSPAGSPATNPAGSPGANAAVTPARTVPAHPDYTQACAPSGLDPSLTCIQVTLDAIDNARAGEHLRPLALPSDFNRLSVPEQLFVAIDDERVDRGLPPFTALTAPLDADAQAGAARGRLPADPGRTYAAADTEWIGAVANGLDAVYEWTYDDGPGSGISGCGTHAGSGCWADRHIVLDDLGAGTLVMGAAVSPTGDTTPDDRGGPSLAAVFATTDADTGPVVYTWAEARADVAQGTMRPRPNPPTDASATGIADPATSISPVPDFTQVCAPSGLDSSPRCMTAVVAAVDRARAEEGVKPMTLPADFGRLPVPQQVFVAVNLERTDRGLPPFARRTPALDRDAQKGADTADDPPDPGAAYDVVDTEWAGGSANGLDAVYGWMYDDGVGSGNLDCPKAGAPGCWGHRHGILDSFGTVGTLVMGAAVNATGDSTSGDRGGTSIAATLAITRRAAG